MDLQSPGTDFDEMSTIPNYLRKKLNLYCDLNTLTLVSTEIQKEAAQKNTFL